ncbi:MAG: sugar transferase [Acidaminococcaceae bacterium]
MLLKKWQDLPLKMQNEAVRPYYEGLQRKKLGLLCKFGFDRLMALTMLLMLAPIFVFLSIAIKLDSAGDVFFRQVRVTQYGKQFLIYKFRTMVQHAETLGAQVTAKQDARVTKLGKHLRSCRLDELPQLINVLKGEMSFVGTRPEVPRYVAAYTPEMLATLLLPAGITSEASILYKDEEEELSTGKNIETIYREQVLPAKMAYNLASLATFSFWRELRTMFKTVLAVLK